MRCILAPLNYNLSQQEGLDLPAFQSGFKGHWKPGEIGHQAGGLSNRIILAEGDKIDTAMITGRPLRRWLLAAMVTEVSAMP